MFTRNRAVPLVTVATTSTSTFKSIFLSPTSLLTLPFHISHSHTSFWSLQDIHVELRSRNLQPLPLTPEESFFAIAAAQVMSVAAGEWIGGAVEGSGVVEKVVDGVGNWWIERGIEEGIEKASGDVAEHSVLASTGGAISTRCCGDCSSWGSTGGPWRAPKPLRKPILRFIRNQVLGPAHATDHLNGHWEGFAVPYFESSSHNYYPSFECNRKLATAQPVSHGITASRQETTASRLAASFEAVNIGVKAAMAFQRKGKKRLSGAMHVGMKAAVKAAGGPGKETGSRRKSGRGKKNDDVKAKLKAMRSPLSFDLVFVGVQAYGVGKVYETLVTGNANPAGSEITYFGVVAGGVMRGRWWTSFTEREGEIMESERGNDGDNDEWQQGSFFIEASLIFSKLL
ncbi:hypothetical protein BC829DRAFT_399576 [Chytridium lagenaria]|nr:hypothetical protein BC829DRAFT_399576 [Chytridium lagenaria]